MKVLISIFVSFFSYKLSNRDHVQKSGWLPLLLGLLVGRLRLHLLLPEHVIGHGSDICACK
jgi:hypothetical protein